MRRALYVIVLLWSSASLAQNVVSPTAPEPPPRAPFPFFLPPPIAPIPPLPLQLPEAPSEQPADQPSVAVGTPSAPGPGRGAGTKTGTGAGAGGPPGSKSSTAALRRGFDVPPAGERRLVADEIIVSAPVTTLDRIAARYGLTRLESATLALTGRTLHLARIHSGRPLREVIRRLSSEPAVAGAGPNYLYGLLQDTQVYPAEKIDLSEAHRYATGEKVVIALIDSRVDAAHPDLVGFVADSYDTIGDADGAPHPHGTGMAGAIARVAPGASLLAVRAFSRRAGATAATTFNLLKAIDWVSHDAQIVNMSFAGAPDPLLREIIVRAIEKGVVVIAAAGNAGPKSPPLYPAAGRRMIAVTATDHDDRVYPNANRGNHIAIAAPGVDVLVPAPDNSYQLLTGTSVAAAEVSGIAALLLERHGALSQNSLRRVLVSTAKDLGQPGHDPVFGAGLVNALRAVTGGSP